MEKMAGLSKRWKAGLIGGGFVLLMAATIPLAIWLTHTTTAQAGNEKARCSSVAQPAHTVVIRGGKVYPSHTTGLQCDTLTIVNQDNKIRLMAFGPHEHHVSYDGVSERVLGPGQSFSVKLIQVGTFYFHDHTDDIVKGSFTVNR